MSVYNIYHIDDPRGEHRHTWCYVHGKAEDYIAKTLGDDSSAPDLYVSDLPIPEHGGIYPAKLNGELDALFFFWKSERYNTDRGLVVLLDDAECMKYALKSFNKRKDIL